MTSHPFNKYEQIMLFYLLSVNLIRIRYNRGKCPHCLSRLSKFNSKRRVTTPTNSEIVGRVVTGFHLAIFMRGQRATGKIPKELLPSRELRSSLTGKTASVSLIFTHGTHRTVKNGRVRSNFNASDY